MLHNLRVARPVSDLARARDMYCRGLGLRVIESFHDHEGFDGVVLATASEWRAACVSMEAAGFQRVAAFNPYWDVRGRTFEDGDGYRVVAQHGEWSNWK